MRRVTLAWQGIALRACASGALLAMVVACAPVRVRDVATTQIALDAQVAREDLLHAQTQWMLHAHLGVSDGHDGGSGELTWRQDAAHYDFSVRAPVTGKTFRLHDDDGGAVLEGVDAQPSHDTDPQRLLREHVGWEVPLAELRAWIFALRANAGPAKITFDANNLPTRIVQDGWTVDYLEWFWDRSPALPRKVFATRGTTRVKLAIENWSLGP